MLIAVATRSQQGIRPRWPAVGLSLILAFGGWCLAGCSGVVSGNSATNTPSGPSNDTTAPQVAITSPAAGATLSGTVNLTANATDNVAVASVQFRIDGTNAGPALTAPPYAYSLNTSSLSNASHSLTAAATDTSGNAATSAAITVQVNNATSDTTPPTVTVTAPANGATVSGTVSVTANASDNVGVASVQFQVDGANVGALDTAAPYSYSWNTTAATNGSHTVRAIAKDAAGNSTTSASVTVTVSNTTDTTAPSVPSGLTATAVSSSQINLSWTASTDNVGVTGYKIFRGGSQIGTTAALSYTDGGLSASTSYTYTAAATDAAGNTSPQSSGASATTLSAGSSGSLPTTLGWFQVPNTQVQPVCPSATQYPDIQGSEGCSAVINDWNSGIADTKRNRLVFWGGGHGGYAGNEIYALDLNTLRMLRLNNPSDPITFNGESNPDGAAASRHTYGGIVYVPTMDKMYVHAGGLYGDGTAASVSVATWFFDMATLKWTRQDPVNGTAVTKDCCNYQSFAAYDPNTDAVYYVDDATFWRYKPQTNTQTQLGSVITNNQTLNAVVDPTQKVFLVFGDGLVQQADLTVASPTLSNITSQTSGCSALASALYPGLAYDPVQKKVVAWFGGNSVVLYDAATKSCSSQSFSGGPGSANVNGTMGRWQYFPSLGVFALVNDWQQNAWVLRMTAASGTGSTSAPVISGVSVSSITTTSATVSWTTDVGSTSQVEYGATTAYGSLTTLASSLTTSHAQNLTGLTVGTVYHYRVHSKNASGNEAISGDAVFSTNASSDTTPPTISITAPSGNATVSGLVTISASASDNVGVSSVQFMVDGANLGSPVTSSPYTASWDTSGVTNGVHILTAQAKDAAGNVATAVGISVTVSNSGTTTPESDFQARCAAPGVMVCRGWDNASDFTPPVNSTGNETGVHPAGPGSGGTGYQYIVQDTTSKVSGNGSLKLIIPPSGTPGFSFNDTPSGYWADNFTGIGQNQTLYVQYRFMVDSNMLNFNWATVSDEGWKISDLFATTSCGEEEITMENTYQTNVFTGYTHCGSPALYDYSNPQDPLLEQGDYVCHYQTTYPSYQQDPGCFSFVPNTWITVYMVLQFGTWGQPNTHITMYASDPAAGRTTLKRFIDLPNFTISNSTDVPGAPFSHIYLENYLSGAHGGATEPGGNMWFDELIISSQPIAAPKF